MAARRRVLVTGASGLLGGRLAQLLAATHDVTALRHRSPTPEGLPVVEADLLAPASLALAVERARPDAIVHSAALADVDACEADPERARLSNVAASAFLARLSHAHGIRLVALSTDLVLTGERAWSTEDARPAPSLVYARTKLEGEEAVLEEAPQAALVRAPLILGRGFGARLSASESIAGALAAGRPLRLFTDQYRTPTDPESIADLVRRLVDTPARGRFHAGGPERLSRYDLALRVARTLGLPESGLEAVTQATHAMGAPRPADVSLDSGRARRELEWTPRPLEAAIREGRPATL